MPTEFQQHQFEKIYPKGIENHYWNHSRNVHIYNTLKKNGLSSSKVLEIGCGRGIVVDYLIDRGVNCIGVELAEGSGDIKNEALFFNTNAADLPKNIRDKIEVVLLLDVIEHIEHPREFLKIIKVSFPRAEHFLIAVPARQEIFSNYDEFNGHFLRYNIKSLKDDVGVLGGKTHYISYLYRLLYWPAFVLKVLNKKRNTELIAPGGLKIIIHKIIAFYFILENKFKLFNLPGTSLIVLIKEVGK